MSGSNEKTINDRVQGLVTTGMHYQCAMIAVEAQREALNPQLTIPQKLMYDRAARAAIHNCRAGSCRPLKGEL